jgi:Icc protein
MLLVQMSDPHFLRRGVLAYGQVDVAGFLKRAVAHVNALTPAVDAVLITGDLTSDGDQATHLELAEILGGLQAPFFPLTGNHDDRELLRQSFAHLGRLPAEGPLCYVVDDFPVRLIALDSLVDGKPHGELGEDQLAWLEAGLDDAPARPTVVALHHPPFAIGMGHMDWSMLRDGEALAAIIGRHPQVERVLCGHAHRPIQRRFASTIGQVAPGVAHQIKLNLGPGHGLWICEPPAVLLHHWDGAGLVTHVSVIGDYGPSGRFSDPHVTAGEPPDHP